MATTTPNIGLTKPLGTEKYDINVVNTNSDIIDTEITDAKAGSNLRPFLVKNDLTNLDNAVSGNSGDLRYANILGNSLKSFKVADAINQDEAVNKGQSEAYTDGALASLSGLFSIDNFLHIQDQKPDGTNGGASVAGYNTRDLNTILVNNISGATLASNQITLPAGKYYIEASSPIIRVNSNFSQIYDASNTNELLSGRSNYTTYSDTYAGDNTTVFGVIDLVATTTIEYRVYTLTAFSYGLGSSIGQYVAGVVSHETYADIRIWKV